MRANSLRSLSETTSVPHAAISKNLGFTWLAGRLPSFQNPVPHRGGCSEQSVKPVGTVIARIRPLTLFCQHSFDIEGSRWTLSPTKQLL